MILIDILLLGFQVVPGKHVALCLIGESGHEKQDHSESGVGMKMHVVHG